MHTGCVFRGNGPFRENITKISKVRGKKAPGSNQNAFSGSKGTFCSTGNPLRGPVELAQCLPKQVLLLLLAQ